MKKFFSSVILLLLVNISLAQSFTVGYSPFNSSAPFSLEYTHELSERFGLLYGLNFDVPNFSEDNFSVVAGPSFGVNFTLLEEEDDYALNLITRVNATFSYQDEALDFSTTANLGVTLVPFSGGILEPSFEAGLFVDQTFDYGFYARLGVARVNQ